MSTDLKSYLVAVATQPDLYSEFVLDPRGAAERAGLSADDVAILLSRDQNLIYTSLRGESTL